MSMALSDLQKRSPHVDLCHYPNKWYML